MLTCTKGTVCAMPASGMMTIETKVEGADTTFKLNPTILEILEEGTDEGTKLMNPGEEVILVFLIKFWVIGVRGGGVEEGTGKDGIEGLTDPPPAGFVGGVKGNGVRFEATKLGIYTTNTEAPGDGSGSKEDGLTVALGGEVLPIGLG